MQHLTLPIVHNYTIESSVESAKGSIMSIARRGDVEMFYIGATVDPVKRWFGDDHPLLSERLQQPGRVNHKRLRSNRDTPMEGHCSRWFAMHLIAVATNAIGSNPARVVETELISFSQRLWPQQCANIVADSRGQIDGINYIYMCERGCL